MEVVAAVEQKMCVNLIHLPSDPSLLARLYFDLRSSQFLQSANFDLYS